VPYHHGDLPHALLTCAEELLEEEGLKAVSLRAVARRAGVSHAAPKNHYASLPGLLSALAAAGFERLKSEAGAALLGVGGEEARLAVLGRTYVNFALHHPGLFSLMFRSELLDPDSAILRQASGGMMDLLANACGDTGGAKLSIDTAERMALAWSQVHGLAVLLLEGQLAPLIARIAGQPGENAFIKHVLAER
jgi:AcrR family transcriptional regulator